MFNKFAEESNRHHHTQHFVCFFVARNCMKALRVKFDTSKKGFEFTSFPSRWVRVQVSLRVFRGWGYASSEVFLCKKSLSIIIIGKIMRLCESHCKILMNENEKQILKAQNGWWKMNLNGKPWSPWRRIVLHILPSIKKNWVFGKQRDTKCKKKQLSC